jgi:hypothetical protein
MAQWLAQFTYKCSAIATKSKGSGYFVNLVFEISEIQLLFIKLKKDAQPGEPPAETSQLVKDVL